MLCAVRLAVRAQDNPALQIPLLFNGPAYVGLNRLIKKLNTGLLVSSKTTGLLPTPINSPKAYYDKRKKNIHVDFQNLNNVKTQSDLLCI